MPDWSTTVRTYSDNSWGANGSYACAGTFLGAARTLRQLMHTFIFTEERYGRERGFQVSANGGHLCWYKSDGLNLDAYHRNPGGYYEALLLGIMNTYNPAAQNYFAGVIISSGTHWIRRWR